MGYIGVIDSGVGGLYVLRCLREMLPNESFIYFADLKNFPYGEAKSEQIASWTRRVIGYMLRQNLKALVVACNTMCAIADFSVIESMVPCFYVLETAALMAAKYDDLRRLGVLTTSATARRRAHCSVIRRLRPDVRVFIQECPVLVRLVERGRWQGPIVQRAVTTYLERLAPLCCDGVLIGCTHFSMLAPEIHPLLGSGTHFLDPAMEIAAAVCRAIREGQLAGSDDLASHVFYRVSQASHTFSVSVRRVLGCIDDSSYKVINIY